MADTYTPNLRLRKPEVGAYNNAWASPLNEMITTAEQSIAGFYQADVTAGNVTLTSNNGTDDQARRMTIFAIGTQAVTNRTITVPDTSKIYLFINDSAKTVTFQRASGGTTLVVNPGDVVIAGVTAAGVFEVPLGGASVADTLNVTQLTLNIGGAHGAGDATVAMEYIVQGSWVFINIRDFNALNFSSAAFSLANNAGNWPAAIVPALNYSVPIIVIENATIRPAYLVLSSSAAAAWGIIRVDTAVWLSAGTDDRAVPHCISFCYPIRSP